MRQSLGICLLAALLLCSQAAQAAVRLCLTVETDAQGAGLSKLVSDELGHFRSHQLVESDCQSLLRVELFTVASQRYLTAHINNEVPVRYRVKSAKEIEEKLSEGLRLVLGHDPVYLVEDTTRYNTVQRSALNLLKRGHNRYRLAGIEVLAATGENPAFASGGAFEVTRGIDHVQVLARLWAAGTPTVASAGQRVVRFLTGFDIGFLYETSARGTATFYLGPGLGVVTLEVQGAGDYGVQSALKVDAAFSGRFGVRFFRQHNFDFDLFAIGYLPLTNAQDVDSELPKSYTPFLQVGLGAGF